MTLKTTSRSIQRMTRAEQLDQLKSLETLYWAAFHSRNYPLAVTLTEKHAKLEAELAEPA